MAEQLDVAYALMTKHDLSSALERRESTISQRDHTISQLMSENKALYVTLSETVALHAKTVHLLEGHLKTVRALGAIASWPNRRKTSRLASLSRWRVSTHTPRRFVGGAYRASRCQAGAGTMTWVVTLQDLRWSCSRLVYFLR